MQTSLRKYEVIELLEFPQEWKVETRKRLSGKLKGGLYKVFINGEGRKFYSLTEAVKSGFSPPEGFIVDARKNRAKGGKQPKRKAKAKAKRTKPAKAESESDQDDDNNDASS